MTAKATRAEADIRKKVKNEVMKYNNQCEERVTVADVDLMWFFQGDSSSRFVCQVRGSNKMYFAEYDAKKDVVHLDVYDLFDRMSIPISKK